MSFPLWSAAKMPIHTQLSICALHQGRAYLLSPVFPIRVMDPPFLSCSARPGPTSHCVMLSAGPDNAQVPSINKNSFPAGGDNYRSLGWLAEFCSHGNPSRSVLLVRGDIVDLSSLVSDALISHISSR